MSKLIRLPSPAMLVALLALCVALGGTVYAANQINGKDIKKGSEPGNRLKKNTVTGKQVKESSLRTVPNATNANTLLGQGPGEFAPAEIEPAHVVGAPGEPPYTNGWTEPTAPVDERLSFYKDPYGIVHLQGNASHSGASTASVFTLPPGYRPAEFIYFAVYAGGAASNVQVTPGGQVGSALGGGDSFFGLSNVSFRAGL